VKDDVGYFLPDGVERTRVCPSDQKAVTGRNDALCDGGDLVRTLAWTEDYFWKSLPERSMVVDSREADVLEWRLAQKLKKPSMRLLRCQTLSLDVFEERADVAPVHRCTTPPPIDGSSSRTVR
jgi:hypothetical protein